MKEKILIIEDDPLISDILEVNLRDNYNPNLAKNGKEALLSFSQDMPDLVLLDLGLPDIDGMELIKSFKEISDTPIIVVSARETEQDKVAALDAGAEDYVSKPFGNEELLARIRRSFRLSTPPPTIYSVGGYEIDFDKHKVTVNNKVVHLTPNEYDIVAYLSLNAGKVLTHDQILHRVWGPFEADKKKILVD